MPSDDNTVRRRSFLKGAGAAAAAATIAGCSGGGGGDGTDTETDDGGMGTTTDGTVTTVSDEGGISDVTLTYSRGSNSKTLDPQNTTSGEDVKAINQFYDRLVNFKPGETNLVAGLATDFSLSGTTTELTLREDVTFHNGEEFTADDFIATYRRFTDSEYQYYPGDDYTSGYAGFTLGSWIDDIQKDGDYSLTINLTQKYAPFLRNLAMFAASVISEKAIQNKGKKLKSQPVGTGPFKLTNWDQGNQQVRMEANEGYWGTGPFVREVVFTVVGSNSSRAQTLDSGGADIIDGLGAQSSKVVENSSNAELLSIPGINIGYMAMNMSQMEEFRNTKVRQAVSYAIDTKAIVENVFKGIAEQASQPIPANVLGYNDDVDPYPYDPDQAQTLLDEAGYGDGFSFELATFKNPRTYNPNPSQAAQVVKSNLGEVGIDVTINTMPFDPFLDYTLGGKHDACFLGWMTDNADPDNFYYALLHPQISVDKVPDGQDWVDWETNGNALNVSAWANTEYMQLVNDAQTTYDEGTRESKYQQAAEIANTEAPWIFMDHAKALRGVHNRVKGFFVAPINGPFLNLVKVEE
jgi:peptide/nickel transport system substrate-binding protein